MFKYITKKYLTAKLNILHKDYLKANREKDVKKLKKIDCDIAALIHVLNEVL